MPDGTTHTLVKLIRGCDARGRELRSMFFKRGGSLEYITAGSTFRRTDAHVVETAEVLSVSSDPYGSPHVRYKVRFQRPARPATNEGQRVLALRSFAERYTERCATS